MRRGMGPRVINRVFAAVVALFVTAAVVTSGLAVWNVRSSFPAQDGELRNPIFDAQVEVVRDAYGIPQIYANTPQDLFRAQGFVHAQDRFFEMDFRRHLTSGRLAEWFGRDALETDLVVRTMGWQRTAELEFEKLEKDTRDYLQAYAEGVNAYLEDHQGSELSVEYTMGLLGPSEEVDPWTPVDSLAWLKAMAWDLRSNVDDEITRVLASTKISPERVDELYPDYPYERHQPIVSESDSKVLAGNRSPGRAATDLSNLPVDSADVADALSRTKNALQAAPSIGERAGIGSNSWVVDGSHTESGMPLLANDPHLSASIPSVWYQTGLHCRKVSPDCPFDVSGFTLAGVPGVVIGHNQDIAWGFTNLAADVSDLYLEQLDGNSYVYDGVRHPLDVRREVFRVKGEADVERDIRETRHGPLLSDFDDQMKKVAKNAPQSEATIASGLKTGVSLRWTALDPGGTANALFDLNTATGWDSFRKAASKFEVPAQNLVYADTEGHIGYQAPGKIPVRKKGNGEWPALGWSSAYDWDGYREFSELPSVKDPKDGIIVTANNAVAGESYPYRLADYWAYGYRSQRIHDQLSADGKLDTDDMTKLQLDTRNGFADELLPHLLNVEVDDFTDKAKQLLRGWDGDQSADSPAAAYFNSVWRKLLQKTFGDELPEAAWPSGGDRWYEVMRPLLKDPDHEWWDNVRTEGEREDRDDIIEEAMVKARLDLTRKLSKDPAKWEWGRAHRLELRNPAYGTSGIGWLEALFNRGPYDLAGGSDAVLATSWDAGADGDEAFYGTIVPSMRMVVDLADLDASRWINLTGQSGHPWHPNYTDQTDLWATGKTLRWPFSESAVERQTEHTLELSP